MKRSFLTLTLFVALGATLISNNTGVATNQSLDRTGSPVGTSQRCEQCHGGASFTVSISMRMKDAGGNTVTSYTPGEAYTYEVELTSGGASAYGFQTVGLVQATNANAGTLTAGSSNTKTKILSGRTYAEHTVRSPAGLFTLNWTAPAAGTGNVKFYAAGIGCNANTSTTGDKPVLGTPITLTENVTSGITETPKTAVEIFPNPFTDYLNIKTAYTGNARIMVSDVSGRTVITGTQVFNAGITTRINMEGFLPGTYYISIIDEQGTQLHAGKFIKQ